MNEKLLTKYMTDEGGGTYIILFRRGHFNKPLAILDENAAKDLVDSLVCSLEVGEKEFEKRSNS